ncbi:MAG: phosphate ABC transporter permease PstA [Verrucomicrobiales bacterium]|nr:phosphate ABC transporter permease PstA [Verrucomicrobiota bacterium JB025]
MKPVVSDSANPFSTTGRSRAGEPWVWLAAAGLALGVVMAVGLFLLILVKGSASFWPGRIELLEIRNGESVEKVAGFITRESERKDQDGKLHEEIQVFQGNKDLIGEAFRYVDRALIVKSSRPESLVRVERMEHGPAILKLVAVETPEGRVDAGEAGFDAALEAMEQQSAAMRARVMRIERKQIGAVSRKMQVLEGGGRSGSIGEAERDERRAELQQEFEALKSEAQKIDAELAKSRLTGTTVDGREMVISGDKLVGVFESNKAGFGRRLGEMFHRMWCFLKDDPREANTEGGVFPAIFGTVVMTLVMSLFVTPLGVIAAIYLREYARQGMLVRIVRICVNNLAGVPSIVFGVFGLAFFVYYVGGNIDRWFFADKLPTPTYGTPGILWASLTLAILTLPVVIVATEEALSAVPRGVREAALACGASKWQAIQRVVLPASLPGILTGVILAMARGAGEVAPLMLVGVVKLAPSLPIDDIAPFIHPERKFMHLGFHIYDLGFQSPDAEAAIPMVYATALLLILVVVTLNLAAILIRNRLKKRFAVSSF